MPLRKLDKAQAKIFMEIEYPQDGPLPSAVAGAGTTLRLDRRILRAILATFQRENPALNSIDNSQGFRLYKIGTMAKVEEAIRLINLQGEGSNVTPEEDAGDLAHYYRFGQIYNEKRYVQNPATGKWDYVPAAPLPLPETWNMADIPAGGYLQADVPDMATWDLISTFDQRYSNLLRLLEAAWLNGNSASLSAAVGEMMKWLPLLLNWSPPRADGAGNYGPCFRYVP